MQELPTLGRVGYGGEDINNSGQVVGYVHAADMDVPRFPLFRKWPDGRFGIDADSLPD